MSPAIKSPPPLLTEAEALTRAEHELASAALVCAEPECLAGPGCGGARVAMQEIWFTCRNGHLNAIGSSNWQEAA